MLRMNGASSGETNPTVLLFVSLPASCPAAYSFSQYLPQTPWVFSGISPIAP